MKPMTSTSSSSLLSWHHHWPRYSPSLRARRSYQASLNTNNQFLQPRQRLLLFSSSSSASSSTVSIGSRDVRLAGRRRFYRNVGVTTTNVVPPWQNHTTSEEEVRSLLLPRFPGSYGSNNSRGQERNRTKDAWPVWYGVTLDGKLLRTPMGQPLSVPSIHLAHTIAVEWDQQASRIQPAQMPIMTLCCTTLDQVATSPQSFQQHSLSYLSTDTTCFYADPQDDRVLYQRQEQAWQTVHDAVQQLWGVTPAKAVGPQEGIIMTRQWSQTKNQTNSLPGGEGRLNGSANHSQQQQRSLSTSLGLPHPPELIQQAHNWCHSLDAWHLAAVHSIATEAKSFLVALYMVMKQQDGLADIAATDLTAMKRNDHGRSIVQKAIEAARVEEEFQISNWGLVEGGHDYDRLNCSIRMYAAQMLIQSIALDNNL